MPRNSTMPVEPAGLADQCRCHLTGCVGMSATGSESASGRQIQQGRCHAGDLGEAAAALVAARDRADQARRVMMQGPVDDVGNLAVFDDAAGIHHCDVVGEARDHGEIVRDPDQRHAAFGGELLHLGEDLGLNGDVERRGWFVRHDQIGLVDQRDRDCHALAHASGELMRIGIKPLVRRGNTDLGERVAGAGLRARDFLMRRDRLNHLRVDAQDRVQRHHRILEDHRNAPATQAAHLLLRQFRKVDAVKQDLAAADPSGRLDQAHDRESGHRLARAGFADEAEHLAAVQRRRRRRRP
jgi:hypothetical protein